MKERELLFYPRWDFEILYILKYNLEWPYVSGGLTFRPEGQAKNNLSWYVDLTYVGAWNFRQEQFMSVRMPKNKQ